MAETSDSRTVGARVVFPALMALILLFMGTALIVRGFCLLAHPARLNDAYWTDIEDGDIVLADDVSLITPLMQTDGAAGRTACCLVGFTDASGDLCLGVLRIPEDDGLYVFYQEYLGSADAALGAYAARGYFNTTSIDAFGGAFSTEYDAACEQYAGVLEEYSAAQYNGNVRATTLCFSYLCGAGENYLTALGRQDKTSGVIGVVIAAAGLLGLTLCCGALVADRRRKGAGSREQHLTP